MLMSIYRNTKLSELTQCLDSLFDQTVKSDDVVIVIDGAIPEDVDDYLTELIEEHNEIVIVRRSENGGLGIALSDGLARCKNELVARMDSDDICDPERFELQLNEFEVRPDCSVIGGYITEFVNTPDNAVSLREVPTTHDDICEYLKRRCPFNHMTVMFKKSDVISAGGYLPWFWNEDYYLWIRMYLAGFKFGNIAASLVKVRTDEVMKRRGGLKYYRSERDIFKYMYRNKIIGFFAYSKAKFMRFILYVMMPGGMRKWVYKKFARKSLRN